MTPNLFGLKKAHWNAVSVSVDGTKELIRSKNEDHAIYRDGDKYYEWDFDVLPGEDRENNTLKSRNREEEYKAWIIKVQGESNA